MKRNLECRSSSDGRETRAYSLSIKAAGEDGTIEGYGSVFGNVDDWDDIIAAGAFKATIAAHKAAGTMPAMLWQHESDEPLGVWTEMEEDANGLKLKGKLCLDTSKGKEALALLKMGAINGLSVGYVSKEWSYNNETNIRTLTEIDLWEVSLVTFPANKKARVTNVKAVDVAGISTIRQAEKALRDVGFADDAAKAFVAEVKRIALGERDAHEADVAVLESAKRVTALMTPL
jgi:HK97 family phage prohead protease